MGRGNVGERGLGPRAEVLSDLRPKASRWRVDLWLSGALARPFMFEPVAGMRRGSEAMAIARGLAPDASGLTGPCEVWMDDALPKHACLAVAVGKDLRDHVERSAKEKGFVLTSLKPWWACALNEAMSDLSRDLRLLSVEEADSLTLISGLPGRFGSVTRFVPKPEPDQITASLTRGLFAADAKSSQGLRAAFPTGSDPESAEQSGPAGQPFGPRFGPLA